ncbi:MAG TPA: efflux RND transporter permease subunit [Verrucomicrobiales bacterium]|nr:efflux RND transporter permease subunit [Verrucomicrobiales bacterium]
MKGLIYWFSRNHVAGNFLMLTILLGGITTWPRLRKEIFPETEVDMVLVQVPYPNAAPEEVENGIVVPIEEAIEAVDGIERVTSIATESNGAVFVEVRSDADTREVMDDLKTRIDAIQNLAEEAEEPVLEELLIKSQVLSVAVSANTDDWTLRQFAERVRDGISALDGISRVELAGVQNYEISIEVSEQTLREYGLTFEQVANAVRNSSLDLPGGSVRTTSGEILLRSAAKRYSADEFASVTVLTRPDGSRVSLGEVAEIVDGFEDSVVSTRIDGRPAILVNVFRSGEENTLEITKLVKEFIHDAPRMFPEGVQLQIWNDTSIYLEGRMRLLAKNGLFGLVLVFIVLALFLRPSLAFLVALGIPVAFAGAILFMPFAGISINLISLFAFILVLGIVVDDAIVVGENVFRRMRLGEDPKIAAPAGTHEVGVVVIFGVLTTVAAFLPMLGVSGVSGKIWRNIPLVVIPTLLVSLAQSKLVLPAHLALLPRLDPNRPAGPVTRFRRLFTDGLEVFVDRVYRPALHFCLHRRYVVMSAFTGLFAVTCVFVAAGWIKFKFFPDVEAEIVSAKLTMPSGSPVRFTAEAVARIENATRTLAEEFRAEDGSSAIVHVLASVGAQPFRTGFEAVGQPGLEENLGEVTLELSPAKDRQVSADAIISRWRELTGPIPGALQLEFRKESEAGGNAIDLELSGNDLAILEKVSREVKAALSEYEGVIDISDSHREGKQEIKLSILPAGEALGLRQVNLARQVRQAFYGEEAQRLQRGRNEVKVMVRYPRDERISLANLEDMKIRLADGAEAPFSAVAEAEFGRGYSTIRRADRRRAVTVSADIDPQVRGASANRVVQDLTAQVFPRLQETYPGIQFKFQGEQKDQRQSVQEIGLGALFALVVVYVLMAIPLRSYVQPLIIMSVIPFGLIGAVAGHLLMRTNLSIMSMCGIVALAGVVVNDSLVLVDYINRHRDTEESLLHAAWEAGAVRFRPILLTSLTTFAGLTPMLLETDLQAKFLIPMAISLSFGVLFATVITLFLIPCIYLALNDLKAFAGFAPKTHAQQAVNSQA